MTRNPSDKPGEFEIIAEFFAPLARAPGALGLGDDAALIPLADGWQMVATADTMVAGVHFFDEAEPEEIATKILAVNVSDLAAMGAEPIGYLLSAALGRDQDADWLRRFAARLGIDQQRYGVTLFGGDTVAMKGPLTLGVTAFGQVPAGTALLRSGARVGETVCVSGTIGDSALGLAALHDLLPAIDPAHRETLIERYRSPHPRIALGRALRGLARAAIDVSDGLIADLGHICETSGAGADLDVAAVPLSPAARAVLAEDPAWLETVLTGGDDYELIFTAPGESRGEIASLAEKLDLALTPIGTVTAGGGVRFFDANGKEIIFKSKGYTHSL